MRGFGPPAGVTLPSPWTWVDHTVSGLRPRTPSPCSDSLSLRLRLLGLTSHEIVTRRFILQKARRHTSHRIVLRLVVGTRFQVLFHSPPGVLFTFPSRYWFTIGRQGVFSLGRWSSRIPTGFHVSRRTQDPSRRDEDFGYVAVTLYGPPFQTCSPILVLCHSTWDVLQPRYASVPVWAASLSLAATQEIAVSTHESDTFAGPALLSSPQGTKMFQFPWSALHLLWIQRWILPD